MPNISFSSKLHDMLKNLLNRLGGKDKHVVTTEDEKVPPSFFLKDDNDIKPATNDTSTPIEPNEDEIVHFSPCYDTTNKND